MDYAQAITYLYERRKFGTKLGIDTIRALLEVLGRPDRALPFIHIAGTNGKGSTAAILESIYRHAGYRTGLFTSPHLISFRERFQIDRQLIAESRVAELVGRIREASERLPADRSPTFFEMITAMAVVHFAESGCELVIWETGMGGRLDATNVVTPIASVITNVDMDHAAWLGDTIAKIAAEKAGIIKPGIPVISAATGDARTVIAERARELGCPLTLVDTTAVDPSLNERVPLPGQHQQWNAALAIATVDQLQAIKPVTPDPLARGIHAVDLAARFQILDRLNPDPNPNSSPPVVIDGAHNPAAVRALVNCFQTRFPDDRAALIVGMMADKGWQEMIAILAGIASEFHLVAPASQRALPPASLAEAIRGRDPSIPISIPASMPAALQATHSKLTLVTGSFYLAGQALEHLKPDASISSEAALNEWQGVKS